MRTPTLPLLVLSACFGASAPLSAPPAPPAPAPPAPLESYAFHRVHGLVKLDLAAERIQPLHPLDAGVALMRSAGVIEDRLYTCVVDKAGGRITSIELATGEHARVSYRDCIAVTAHGQRIWILPERGEFEEFRNLATLRSGSSPNREIERKLASAVVVAANASHLFVASDRGELARIDRTTAELQPLSIQLGDEPIQGMTATRTRLYIAGRRGIHELELSTGRRLRTLFATETFGALTAPRAPATAPRP